jgi:putative SOS response-associated peptidase YedK
MVSTNWQKLPGGGKQPYGIVGTDGRPFAMAGLWDRWKESQSGAAVQTFSIITGPPNELVASIHNRMPVILRPDRWATWLWEHEVDTDELRWMILRPYPAELMRAYPVDVRVGNVRNNGPELLNELAA